MMLKHRLRKIEKYLKKSDADVKVPTMKQIYGLNDGNTISEIYGLK